MMQTLLITISGEILCIFTHNRLDGLIHINLENVLNLYTLRTVMQNVNNII